MCDERSVVPEITGSQQVLNTIVIFYVVNSRQIHIMVCVSPPHVESVPEMLRKLHVHLFGSKLNILSGKHCDKNLNPQTNFHIYILTCNILLLFYIYFLKTIV